VRYILSRRFHEFLGERGTYTRKRGLDRNTNMELLLKHIRDNRKTGSRLADLQQVLPDVPRGTIRSLMSQLRTEGRITCVGRTRGARWFPAEGPQDEDHPVRPLHE